MKRIIPSLRDKIAAVLLILLTAGHTFAQDANDTVVSESSFQTTHSKFSTNLYDGTIPHIALGVVFMLILYVGYRYWHDNRTDDDIRHTPHHQ